MEGIGRLAIRRRFAACRTDSLNPGLLPYQRARLRGAAFAFGATFSSTETSTPISRSFLINAGRCLPGSFGREIRSSKVMKEFEELAGGDDFGDLVGLFEMLSVLGDDVMGLGCGGAFVD